MDEEKQTKTLREVARVLAARFWGMLIVFLVVVVAVALATYMAPRWYRSEVRLMASPTRLVNPLETGARDVRDEISLFVVTQREIVMSNYVLASALMKLRGVEPQKAIKTEGGRLSPWYTEDVVARFIEDNRREMVKVAKRVTVLTPGGQQASFAPSFTIQVDWPEESGGLVGEARKTAAENACKMAGFVKDAYLIRYSELETARAQRASDFFQTQSFERAKTVLAEAEKAKKKFVEDTLKGDLIQVIHFGGKGGGSEAGVAKLSTQFKGEINRIDEQIAVNDTLLAAVNVELARANAAEIVIPDAVTEVNPVLGTMQTRMVTLRLQHNVLEPKYTAEHRELINIKEEMVLAEKDLRNELAKQATRMSQELDVLKARRKVLGATVDADQSRLDALAINATTYDILQEEVLAARASYTAENERLKSANTAKDLAASPVLVTEYDRATKPDPDRPRRPMVMLNMLVAFLGGLVLAMIYAFLADYFDHSIKSREDAMRHLDVPVLASIPTFKKQFIKRN